MFRAYSGAATCARADQGVSPPPSGCGPPRESFPSSPLALSLGGRPFRWGLPPVPRAPAPAVCCRGVGILG
eukprot:2146108-Alexandrium_andersonii.AAC.1